MLRKGVTGGRGAAFVCPAAVISADSWRDVLDGVGDACREEGGMHVVEIVLVTPVGEDGAVEEIALSPAGWCGIWENRMELVHGWYAVGSPP